MSASAGAVERWRHLLLAILALGFAGTGAELVLLGHYEEWQQWAPLAGLGLGLVTLLALGVRPGPGTVRVFRGVMLLLLIAALAGLWFHFRSNLEFELEMYPGREGWELYREALSGAMPALAPGALVQMGLLGLLATWRHPALAGAVAEPSPPLR